MSPENEGRDNLIYLGKIVGVRHGTSNSGRLGNSERKHLQSLQLYIRFWISRGAHQGQCSRPDFRWRDFLSDLARKETLLADQVTAEAQHTVLDEIHVKPWVWCQKRGAKVTESFMYWTFAIPNGPFSTDFRSSVPRIEHESNGILFTNCVVYRSLERQRDCSFSMPWFIQGHSANIQASMDIST